MKTRAMISSSVVMTDEFLGMGIDSQLIYILLLFEADVVGRIVGIRRIIKGYGVDEACLEELEDAGFLMRVNGEWFDRHAWRNNKFSAKIATRAETDEAISNGLLQFEREPFKSSYTLATPKCDEVTPNRSQETIEGDVIRLNGKSPVPAPASAKAYTLASSSPPSSESQWAEEDDWHPCLCPKCHEEAVYRMDTGGSIIRCKSCGEFPLQR